jgi:glucose-6-phosphate-specific signal transduction histidine kinase
VMSGDSAAPEQAGVGHGLPGMRERALLAGGTLAVHTPPGRFSVIARIPATAPGIRVPPTVTDPAKGVQQ